MTKRIFRSIFIVAIIIFIVSTGFIVSILYDYFTGEYSRMIKNDSSIIANGVNQYGADYLHTLPVDDDRVTLIAADGTVLFDNFTDASTMENHLDREEVIEALSTGYGESERYSKTMSEKTYNYALLLGNGQVLRLSITRITIISLLLAMLQPILVIIAIAIVLSLVISAKISKSVVKPINQLNLDNPVFDDTYEELHPLLKRITEQNKQIENQLNVLEQNDRLRREFTANVSHELKTPLTAISGTAEILQNGLVKSEDVAHFAGNIYTEAQRLIVLVGDIIKLSQLDEYSVMLEKEQVDLYDIAEDVIERLSLVASEKDISIELKGKHLTTYGVRQIIDDMIYNLCDNAVKYNKTGGRVTIDIDYSTYVVDRNENLQGSTESENGFIQGSSLVSLTVTDTGIGIPDELRERVFERFYRVDKSHSKEIGGTGLGLSIVKHGAAYHDAIITMDSKVDEGTSITIRFTH